MHKQIKARCPILSSAEFAVEDDKYNSLIAAESLLEYLLNEWLDELVVRKVFCDEAGRMRVSMDYLPYSPVTAEAVGKVQDAIAELVE